MRPWREAVRAGLVTGTIASATSTAALAVCGMLENGQPAAPTNAISHWLWGDGATWVSRPTSRHTLTGYAIHHGASVFWGTLYERYLADARRSAPEIVARATFASALACFVDYQLTPRRLRPGFEQRLSRRSLLAVYAAFGAGLAAATLWRRGRG
jgi:hypothetical protein